MKTEKVLNTTFRSQHIPTKKKVNFANILSLTMFLMERGHCPRTIYSPLGSRAKTWGSKLEP